MTVREYALYTAPASRLPMKPTERVTALTGGGLVGDRYENARHRHISVFSTGEMADADERFGTPIPPELTRRNVLLDAGLLPRQPGHRFTIGDVQLEVVRDAAPCRMLDMEIGDGARAAMRRRAGVICRVLEGGEITLESVAVLGDYEPFPT